MTFILDSDTLGFAPFNFAETIIGDRGRAISLTWTQDTLNQDFELLGYSVRFFPAEEEPKEQV